jgi:hypothetical protein
MKVTGTHINRFMKAAGNFVKETAKQIPLQRLSKTLSEGY